MNSVHAVHAFSFETPRIITKLIICLVNRNSLSAAGLAAGDVGSDGNPNRLTPRASRK